MSAGRTEMFLRASTLDGVSHGFATRGGGVSVGPYASLNLGRATGDDEASVAENHRRLAAAAGFDGARLATPARQVHGATVVRAAAAEDAACDCDAVVSHEPGLVLGVRTADCVPVLLWDPVSGGAGAVHAGWRGIAASIVPAAVAAMDSPPSRLRAAIGPSIGECCYEVDEATAARVSAAAPHAATFDSRPGHVRIDLVAGVWGQLTGAGVPADAITEVGGCTSCRRDLFFSHRRDEGVTGRHLSFVVAGRSPRHAPSRRSSGKGGVGA